MTSKYATKYYIPELLACFLSHDLQDGEELIIGATSPIARGAALLAHFTHAPNMSISLSYSHTNVLHVPVLPSLASEVDYRQARWAEFYWRDEDAWVWTKRRNRLSPFFIGAIQIDKYGNSNLLGVGKDYKKLKLRGPGAIGTTGASTYRKHFYLMANTHSKQVFVDECDYITAVGWGEGGADGRRKLGLPGDGPKYVLTPLCIMDFEEQTKRMRLKSVHPGIVIQDVVDSTGFELLIPKHVPTTESPTEEEIEILRARIDQEGLLRR